MAVAPLIAMKGSQVESLEAVGMELDRRAHTYVNDVSEEHRHIGYCCRAEDERPMPLERAVERRMGELNTKRKIRDNQVRAMGFIVSTNDALDETGAREFLDKSVRWFGARYGIENLLAAQIHLDEGTPHAHIWVAPVIHDSETGFDRLCAKELFAPDKRRKNAEGKWEVTSQGTMSRLQEDFWEQVARFYGYERPLRREQRAEGYRSLEAYKVHVGTTRALRADLTALESEKRDREMEAERAARKAAQAARDADAAADRLESVRQELGEVEGIAGAGLFELAKRAKGCGDGERERAAQAENRELRARLAALEGEGGELAGRVRKLEGEKRGLEDENRGLRGRLDGLGRRLDDAWAELVAAAGRLRGFIFEQVGALKWVFDALGIESHEGLAPLETSGYGFHDEVADARSAARSTAQETNRRSRWRSR